jgi:hypothetical protein
MAWFAFASVGPIGHLFFSVCPLLHMKSIALLSSGLACSDQVCWKLALSTLDATCNPFATAGIHCLRMVISVPCRCIRKCYVRDCSAGWSYSSLGWASRFHPAVFFQSVFAGASHSESLASFSSGTSFVLTGFAGSPPFVGFGRNIVTCAYGVRCSCGLPLP